MNKSIYTQRVSKVGILAKAGAWNLNQRGGGEAAPAKWQVRCSRI